MKKRHFAVLLCTLALSAGLTATAAAAEKYPDLSRSHWAYESMDKAVGLGILKGVGEGRMAPDETLTWAQCLTIAARTFAPETYARAAAQGEPWDRTAYNACAKAGFLLPEWEDALAEDDLLGAPISRADTAVLLSKAIPAEVKGQRVEYDYDTWERRVLTAQDTLADFSTLTKTRQSAVSRLFDLEIVKGSPVEENGGTLYLFNGEDTLHRSDGATMFVRALAKLDSKRSGEKKTITIHVVDGDGAALMEDIRVESAVGRDPGREANDIISQNDALHYYTRYPEDMDSWDVTGVSVSTACDEYTLVYYPMNEMERARQDFFDAVLRGELSYEDYWWQPFNRYELGENDLKCFILFGDRNKRRYSSQSEAKEHQTTVTVPLWRIDKNGKKYASKGSFQINANIADDVVKIFTEIFENPEQFPIKDLGGYGWRGDSATGEHNCGTAIDINPNENYQIRDGRVMVGSCWDPEGNPYSMSATGSVVRIFAKYGWSWGGDAWAAGSDPTFGYHDYMHFSYMGG